jgi:hypothetical protein
VADSIPTSNSPFIVGVSGHRDLDPSDAPRLRSAVTDFVHQLKRLLPDTELRIIVGMAEGADLLVTQAALDLGVPVEAVLPMSLEQYAADFDPESLVLLRRLLARSDVRCTELSPPAHLRHADGTVDNLQRDVMFENLTETLIRRSSILLALWDGNPSRLPGGTADTVLRYLGVRTDAEPAGVRIEFIEATGEMQTAERLVYWTPAPRISSALAAHAQGPCFLRGVGDNALEMQQDMPSQLTQELAALNHYNQEYQQLLSTGRLGVRDSLLAALPAEAPLHDKIMLQDIDAQYTKADALAIYYQLRSDGLFALFGFMTFAMGLAYLVYEQLTESRVLLFGYLFVLLSSLAVFYILNHKHWFAKHLIYRAIAETMRAKFYLRVAGIDHRVDPSEVLALSGVDRFRGFGWIGYVLRGVESLDIHVATRREDDAQRSRCVEQTWIESQHRYFTKKVARLERSSGHVHRLKNTVFAVILIVITVLVVFGESLADVRLGIGVPLNRLLTFCMGFLAVLLGAWELHQDKMATHELLWQYRNQLSHFGRARMQLARITSPRRRDDLLVELGKDSLMESYLWTIHRYHREHEPPVGQ